MKLISVEVNFSPEENQKHYPFFVYGTLRRQAGNHHLLLGNYEKAEVVLVPGISMTTSRGSVPFSFVDEGNPDARLVVEEFTMKPEVYSETRADIDRLEGYRYKDNQFGYSNFYNRALITFIDDRGVERKGWIYLVDGENEFIRDKRIIVDWLADRDLSNGFEIKDASYSRALHG